MDRKPATYQDVVDAPPDRIAEIILGRLHLSPRLPPPHSVVKTHLVWALSPCDEDWLTLLAPELHLAGDVLVPDLTGWVRERLPQVPEDYISIAPDWVCEVLAGSTERVDRIDKMHAYAAVGVKHVWLVTPRLRTLEAYELVDDRWSTIALHGDAGRVRIAPFAEIELDLASLWAAVPLPTAEGLHHW